MYQTILVTLQDGTQYYFNRKTRKLDRADKVIVDDDTEQYHCDESDLDKCQSVCDEMELQVSDVSLSN